MVIEVEEVDESGASGGAAGVGQPVSAAEGVDEGGFADVGAADQCYLAPASIRKLIGLGCACQEGRLWAHGLTRECHGKDFIHVADQDEFQVVTDMLRDFLHVLGIVFG